MQNNAQLSLVVLNSSQVLSTVVTSAFLLVSLTLPIEWA